MTFNFVILVFSSGHQLASKSVSLQTPSTVSYWPSPQSGFSVWCVFAKFKFTTDGAWTAGQFWLLPFFSEKKKKKHGKCWGQSHRTKPPNKIMLSSRNDILCGGNSPFGTSRITPFCTFFAGRIQYPTDLNQPVWTEILQEKYLPTVICWTIFQITFQG